MADQSAGFGRRVAITPRSASVDSPTGKIHFSLFAFLAATAVLTFAIPFLTGLAALSAGVNFGEAFRKVPGGNAGLRFFIYWLECMALVAPPLAIAGFPQRILMNRMNWTSRAHFALLGGGWAFFCLLVLSGIAIAKAGTASHVLLFFLAGACAIPFGIAHGLIYRSLGGLRSETSG